MKRLRIVQAVLLAAVALLALRAIADDHRGPFTHAPRSIRTRPFDVKHTRLELQFDWDKRVVDGRAVHTLVPFAPIRRVDLDRNGLEINRAALLSENPQSAEKELAFETTDGKVAIELDRQYGPEDVLRIAVDYRVSDPDLGVHFVVPDENEPEQRRIVWTQSEPNEARAWFPCFDSPTERLTSEVLVTVPADYFVLSNGVLRDKHDNHDGTRTWHWVQEQTHVAYLISVVAGEFEAYEQSWDGIPIVSYVPPGRRDKAPRSFENTPAMLQFFSEKIDYRYPWPKYAQICCDEFGGGMEHTSATTLTLGTLHDERAELDVSSEGLVAHELAHQWWGDLLTCKDWAELWLNESFATYFATLWTEHHRGWDEATWEGREEAQTYFDEDRKRYRRPLVTYSYDHPWNMFDEHSYPKGGRVLHMLRFVLGDEAFWKAMRHYAHKHAFGVVETADLRVAIEEATGNGLNWFFDEWVYHGGYPEFDVSYSWDDDAKLVRLTVRQTQTVDDMTPLFRTPVEIDLVTPSETITRRIAVSKAEETFHFSLPERPRRVCFDGRNWLLKKLTFEKSKEEWLDQLAHDPDLICRIRAAEGLAKFKPDADVLAALSRALDDDAFWGVRKVVAETVAQFGGEAAREALLQAAKNDPKSEVRRAAIKALKDFPHETTRTALREIIAHDPSYYAVADALTTLAKVDRDGAPADLTAALDRPSHRDVILRSAANALADLGHTEVRSKLAEMLTPPVTAKRRAAVLRALAKLGGGDPNVTETIAAQLDNTRRSVRSAAIEALGETGDPAAIEILLTHRAKARHPRWLAAIDDAVAKLRNNTDLDRVRKQLESVEKKNQALESRLKKLEEALNQRLKEQPAN